MGMTIEEKGRYTNACIKYLQKNMECINFRDYIIERLNKYQKIEQILDDCDLEAWEVLEKVKKVVEDGNNSR